MARLLHKGDSIDATLREPSQVRLFGQPSRTRVHRDQRSHDENFELVKS